MTDEERRLREAKWRHLRRVKRWLRPLPRRANIHRYPILRYFAKAAKKRAYLWSFREKDVIPAIYAGCVLTLLPLYGIQIPLSVAVALLLRANLPILAGLQLLSNPLTAIPLWFADYQVGRILLSIFGIEVRPLAKGKIQTMIDNFTQGRWGENFEQLAIVMGIISLGAIVLGTFFGLLGSIFYRVMATRAKSSYRGVLQRIQQLKEKRISEQK